VKAAVHRYLEKGQGDGLAQMFANGIPLHDYPESREIIINLLTGKANRKRGRPKRSQAVEAQHYAILLRVAELHGAGLGLFSGSDMSDKPTACSIASKIYGLDAEYIYKHIWKPNKDREDVKHQEKIGADNRDGILSLVDI
jgi:hypothetical protein